MSGVTQHRVRVTVGSDELTLWSGYDISVDILQPADAFSLSCKASRAAWDLLALDAEVQVWIDDSRILSGFIGARTKEPGGDGGGTVIQVEGRDRAGRLVDESAPLFAYGGQRLQQLVERLVGIGSPDALFERVTLLNTSNRRLMTNGRARSTDEPALLTGAHAPRRVLPGQGRWAVLEEFLRESRMLAWSTANGRELFVGQPNQAQEPQYRFFEAAEGSARAAETNSQIRIAESVEDRYSEITCVGKATGTDANYGSGVTKNRGTATSSYTGWSRPKRLLISDDSVKGPADALERAEREMLERDAAGHEVLVRAPGHSQLVARRQAVFAPDTIARVEDELTGLAGDYLVTAVTFSDSRESGTRTELRMVPRGTILVI